MSQKVLWQKTPDFMDYPTAVADMESYALAIYEEKNQERVWLLEHPPLYTMGTSASPQDVLPHSKFPCFETGRGGQVTYHGPGQRVAYVQLNLKNRTPDIRKYIFDLEEWLILTLFELGITGERRENRIGIWVDTPKGEKKIAAIGVRVQKWVTLHGIALNVNPDLSHYDDIIPCGLREYGVTSLHDLGIEAGLEDIDAILMDKFPEVFRS